MKGNNNMYKVNLPVQQQTYEKLLEVSTRLQQGEKKSLSREYGNAVTTMACEVLRVIFGIMTIDNEYTNGTGAETKKVMEQVTEQLQKYMPWSVSLFGNERLLPVVNYLMSQIKEKDGTYYLQYNISPALVQQLKSNAQAISQNEQQKITAGFANIVQIIEVGIDELIKKPKDMLKFNIVADKTLNGVIKMLTSLGNKRIEKTGQSAHIITSQQYMGHFVGLISEE